MNTRIAFDIGGVISKYPDQFFDLMTKLKNSGCDLFIITDMHNKDEVVEMLVDNSFDKVVSKENVYCADYVKHGEMCKAVLLRDLQIDMFYDDFIGYLQWDSSFGPAPIRLLVQPDAFIPYYAKEWTCSGDFGRRVFTSPHRKEQHKDEGTDD